MALKQSTATLLGLPWVPDVDALVEATGLSAALLNRLLEHPERQYKVIRIPKKSGSTRVLHSPTRVMKAVQGWILRSILEKVRVDSAATAYLKGVGLLRNVLPHKDNHVFLCLDLKDFFPSISRRRVRDIFETLGYTHHSADLLARLCTVDGHLPQGGVTSPYLSNVACMRMDRRIRKFVNSRHVVYTRYSDDITLSAKDPRHLFSCVELVKTIIREEGFSLNDVKTRVLLPHHRRVVTGLIVSHAHRVGVGRKQYRLLRAEIHKLETKTLSRDDRITLQRHVVGWLSFLRSVDRQAATRLEDYWSSLKVTSVMRAVAAASGGSHKPLKLKRFYGFKRP